MGKVTVGLLGTAYLCLASALAVYIWRAGGGWGPGVAALVGGLGFAFSIHGGIRRGIDAESNALEISSLRRANLLLTEQLRQMSDRIEDLAEDMQEEAARQSEELTSEVRVLEDLVQRMSQGMATQRSRRPVAELVTAHETTTELLETVRLALTENRVDLFLQPVVALPQRRTVFYESFSRLRDKRGRVMMPAEYLEVAEPDGLVSVIDNLLLFRCVQIVRRLARQDRKVGIFCNISLSSLSDEAFFPQFREFMAENRDLSGALIFELGQDSFEARGPVAARNMALLTELGFRFSLDKVTNLDLDFQELAQADVRYLKIGADVLLDQLLDVEGRTSLRSLRDLDAADFADLARRYGVDIIAEKVESERHVIDVLELNIAYGQGHLFGEPRAIRDSVLTATAPPVEYAVQNIRRTGTR
jgi:cyclic-di-GMP phosphodiesterase TipF (flagellum assembly factor)